MPVTAASARRAIGARFTMKSMKLRPVAPAIMMFGGSPMSVAVPPMFDAMTSMMIRGMASMSSVSATRNVIGTTSRTVVRLSRKALNTAVEPANPTTTKSERPRASWPARIARYV
jgi:hypothetical protein